MIENNRAHFFYVGSCGTRGFERQTMRNTLIGTVMAFIRSTLSWRRETDQRSILSIEVDSRAETNDFQKNIFLLF